MRLALPPELIRFGLVTVLGLGIDLGLAWTLATLAGLPLPAATLGGFLVAAAINYVLHEFWTFSSGARKASAARGLAYAAGLGLTIGTRLLVVTLLAPLAAAAGNLPVLLVAVGCSFVVNFLFSKYVVFRPRPAAAFVPAAKEGTRSK